MNLNYKWFLRDNITTKHAGDEEKAGDNHQDIRMGLIISGISAATHRNYLTAHSMRVACTSLESGGPQQPAVNAMTINILGGTGVWGNFVHFDFNPFSRCTRIAI